MIQLKGGIFEMGSGEEIKRPDPKDVDESPLHRVRVSPFYMSKYEVTNGEFCTFLNLMGNQIEGGVRWMGIKNNEY